jgi:nucleotide sugar dehydrogenase
MQSAAVLDRRRPAAPRRSAAAPRRRPRTATPTVAVLGLGYVGLPTSLALSSAGFGVLGIDVSRRRLEEIRAGRADLLASDQERLGQALDDPRFDLSTSTANLADADVVLICVPTPTDEELQPDLRILRRACATVVDHARDGQTIVLTSTSYVGTTRDLLVRPLEERGFAVGTDVHVAFSPERIDPGNTTHTQEQVPRVLGGATEACTEAAAKVFEKIADHVHRVSSPEAAELTKLYENTFRAVNIAFAYEMAEVSRACGLNPTEIVQAAATKPYGFMAFHPGAGVGGHCIPCDPHYLLASLPALQVEAPFVRHGMQQIADRPRQVARRVRQILVEAHGGAPGARVLVVGASYKPDVQDVRESPALEIISELRHGGVRCDYHDPLVPSIDLPDGLTMLSVAQPDPAEYALVVLVTCHSGFDYAWMDECDRVLDCTYRTPVGRQRFLI